MSGSGATYYDEELIYLYRLLKNLPDVIPEGNAHDFTNYVPDPQKAKDFGCTPVYKPVFKTIESPTAVRGSCGAMTCYYVLDICRGDHPSLKRATLKALQRATPAASYLHLGMIHPSLRHPVPRLSTGTVTIKAIRRQEPPESHSSASVPLFGTKNNNQKDVWPSVRTWLNLQLAQGVDGHSPYTDCLMATVDRQAFEPVKSCGCDAPIR
ncbi:hypothetical protein B0H14DRAFT_2601905 [Mycena olivaceomarginata]|nr:hypothetical protein B0H14DRAFT_2601905 [Mycena olivaceomarginata]